MDTIAINTNEVLNEGGQEKKKNKISDTTKAAMATGAAGLAAGAAVKSAVETLADDSTKEQETVIAGQAHQDEITPETETIENSMAEINPNDVMLEEPVAEQSSEENMVTEGNHQTEEGNDSEYQPFANNDRIGDEVLPEPQPDEILVAENTETDAVTLIEDLIIGLPAPEPDPLIDPVYSEDELYADSSSNYGESEIQSDLMA